MFLFGAAIELSKERVKGMEIEYVDISPLPMLNTDLEGEGGTFPPAVEAFRQKILEADSVLFASPEYNYSVTGTLLNGLRFIYLFLIELYIMGMLFFYISLHIDVQWTCFLGARHFFFLG